MQDYLTHFSCNRVALLSHLDDFHLNSAISILKWVVERYGSGRQKESGGESDSQNVPSHDNEERTSNSPSRLSSLDNCTSPASGGTSSGSSNVVPVRALTLALEACRQFLRSKEHLDIDDDPRKVNDIRGIM